MATIIDSLIITLGLDPKGVGKGMAEAKTTLDGGVKNIATQIVGPLSALLAGAFAGKAIMQRFVDAAELGKLSRQLNTSVEDLQAWQGAAIAAGGSAEGLVTSAKALREKTGSRLPITQQLMHMADQLKRVPEWRAMDVGKSMGLDEGTIKLLRQGRAGVQELVAAQRGMVAFRKEDIATIQKVRQGYDSMRALIFSLSNLVVKLFLPALHWMSEKLQASSGFFPEVRRRMGLVSQWIEQNSPRILTAFGAIAAMLTARMVPALARTALAMLPLLPFILIVGGLAFAFEDLMTYINGGESAFGGLWSQLGTGEEIMAMVNAAWAWFTSLLKGLPALLPGVLALVGAFTAYKAAVAVLLGVAKAVRVVRGAFMALRVLLAANPLGLILTVAALVIAYWDDIAAGAKKAGAVIQEAMGKAGEWIETELGGAIETVKGWINELMALWDKVTDLPGKARDAVKGMGGAVAESAIGMWAGTKDFFGFGGSAAVSAADAVPPAATSSRTSSIQAETRIDKIEIITQATDAQGIAQDIGKATRRQTDANMVNAANSGVARK